MRLSFGDCRLDLSTRELWRGGRPVAVSPQAFQLLSLLVERRPRAVPHADLRDALWPRTHVGYSGLARVVCELRRALGDAARGGTYVRTVPRFGYAFAAAVEQEGSPPCALLVAGDGEYGVQAGETLVGGLECGVRLSSPQVSRVHARLRVGPGRATVEDRRSRNGTWVNGLRISGPVAISDGDEVLFGTYRVVFRTTSPVASTRSPPA